MLTRYMINRRWAILSIAALAAFAVLAVIDTRLKRITGFGALDLQRASTAAAVQTIALAWATPGRAFMAGLSLGFDYLFMPLYGFAFYYAARSARESFAPQPNALRVALLIAAFIPLLGALLDVGENALEALMLMRGPSDGIAALAATFSSAKWLCIFIGFVLALAGLVGLFWRRRLEQIPGKV